MKKTLIIALCAFVLTSLASGCAGKKDWAAKINGKVIPMSEFLSRYDMYMEMRRQQAGNQPMSPDEERMLKREILKNMISEDLVYDELKREGFDQSKETKELFRTFLIQKYLEKKLLPEINITPEETDAFYRQNKDYFKGMDPEQAQQQVQYQLTLKKFQEKTSEIIERLYAKAKVDQNDQVFLPVSLPAVIASNRAPAK